MVVMELPTIPTRARLVNCHLGCFIEVLAVIAYQFTPSPLKELPYMPFKFDRETVT